MSGFIERYINLHRQITDASEHFLEAAAYYLVSTFAKDFVYMSTPKVFPREDVGGGRLNVWFILIGKSRIGRKSTVISTPRAWIEEIKPDIMLPFDFTPQSLVTELDRIRRNQGGLETHATWINDEISGFFEHLSKGDYMLTVDTYLSKIYDCEDVSRSTIARGREEIRQPYMTCLLASTGYLPALFDDGRLRQGFLNRFIYVVDLKKDELRAERSEPLASEEKRESDWLLSWLKALNSVNRAVVLDFDKEAKQLREEYTCGVEEWLNRADLGIKEGYYGNLPEIATKIACLTRISRLSVEQLKDEGLILLQVEGEDMETGMRYANKAWKWFEEMLRLRAKARRRPATVYTMEDYQEVVRDVFKRYGGVVDRTTLLRETGISAKMLDDTLQTLDVEQRVEKGEGPGRPKIVYYLRK